MESSQLTMDFEEEIKKTYIDVMLKKRLKRRKASEEARLEEKSGYLMKKSPSLFRRWQVRFLHVRICILNTTV